MPLEYTPVSKLNSSKQEWKTRVLMSRAWNFHPQMKPDFILGMEIILWMKRETGFKQANQFESTLYSICIHVGIGHLKYYYSHMFTLKKLICAL
ncbi:unnamed protein product [Microthlaspi erraticum]|uniref:Uncharacterized protein n=1 Tax=Microthlaspi erraticum TaxID=1685480 RepID=A0A6D2JKK8_9BRAS|nr:unnamed protein product [Microthlaspi erraticum]